MIKIINLCGLYNFVWNVVIISLLVYINFSKYVVYIKW